MTSKRNSSIDIFRLIAVAAVIIQHYGIVYPRTSETAMWFNLFSRIAVPFFFMVSGYFSWKSDPAARHAYLKKQAATIAKILTVSSVIIIFFNNLFGYHIIFKPKYLLFLFLYNDPFFLFDQSHIWYMLALIYVLLIALLVEKCRLHKAAYISVPILLTAAVALDLYLRAAGIRRACYTRNFLFDGLPFFYLGQLLRRYEDKILPRFSKGRSFALLLLSAAGLVMEAKLALRFNLTSFDITFDRTMFVFIPFLAIAIFILLLNFPDIGRGTFIARYARDASMIIYIIHHIVEEFIKIIAANVWGLNMSEHATARYFLILFFSSVIGFGYAVLQQRLRRNINS
ncbi:MAG: acyltransferase family protein [Clostridia bacterium]